MKMNQIAKSLALASPFLIFLAAPGIPRAQGPTPQLTPPSASSPAQADPYTAAFAGLTYTDEQKAAISKIRQDIESRKAVVRKSDKLDQDQKNAMLTGYARIEYSQIYDNVLTPEQRKLVSAKMHAHHASGQAAPNTQPPAR